MKIKEVVLSAVMASSVLSMPMAANAGMEPFIGEVQWFAGNFAPRGWALCDGQLLPINQHQALFSILGTTYGGDGRTTFALPDVRGRALVHAGNGPGLTERRLGSKGGEESVTLTTAQIPEHSHALKASSASATTSSPEGTVLAKTGRSSIYADTADTTMSSAAIASSGGGQAHNNMQPYNTLNCIIALQGLFPSRN